MSKCVNKATPELIGRAFVPYFLEDEQGADKINDKLQIPEDQLNSEMFTEEASVEVREFRDGYYQPVVKREGTGHRHDSNPAAGATYHNEHSQHPHPAESVASSTPAQQQKPQRHMKKLMSPADMMRQAQGAKPAQRPATLPAAAPAQEASKFIRAAPAPAPAPAPVPAVSTTTMSKVPTIASVGQPPRPLTSASPETRPAQHSKAKRTPPVPPIPQPKVVANRPDSAHASDTRKREKKSAKSPREGLPPQLAVPAPMPLPKPAPAAAAAPPPPAGLSSHVVQGGQVVDVMQLFAQAREAQGGNTAPASPATLPTPAPLPISAPAPLPVPAPAAAPTGGSSHVMQGGQAVDVMQLFAQAKREQQNQSAAIPQPAPVPIPAPAPVHTPQPSGKKGKSKANASPKIAPAPTPQSTPKAKPAEKKVATPTDKKTTAQTHFAMPASMTAPPAANLPMPSFLR